MCGKTVSILFLLLVVSACASTHPYGSAEPPSGPAGEAEYRVILLGNTAGMPTAEVLASLKRSLHASDPERTAVVFLGDNVEGGLADSSSDSRAKGETQLRALLDLVADFDGRVLLIPGDEDWSAGRQDGFEAIKRQQRFVEAAGRVILLPDDGFPGPVLVKLTDRVTLLAVDTQWWLHRFEKGIGGDIEEHSDFILELEDEIAKNRDQSLLVVGHHPVASVGEHGGFFTVRDHIFPLTNWIPGAYLPLPVIGSLYPLYVRLVGRSQDLSHSDYKSLRQSLLAVFSMHERLVYVSAHDKGLQHFRIKSPTAAGSLHQIVSGGGSGTGQMGRGAAYANGSQGFAEIVYFEDGSEQLTFRGKNGEQLYRTNLNGPLPELVDPMIAEADFVHRDSMVVMAANADYDRGPVQRLVLGSHNRDAWAAPVGIPVLDLTGLEPVKRGGGQQTLSLRLIDEKGNEYVLRSIDKDPSKTVPVQLQGTVATDLVQDQISSIHPYGAFIVPVLAEAAGVYHTKPKLVYVPRHPALGVYKDFFGGSMMMFEERPDGDESERPNFGRSRDVISPQKLFREIDDDNDHRVDQAFYLRSRLFDMLLSDWDRHRDQWRWASFEPYELDPTLEGEERERGKVYRPIPRDRDWAFNRMSGPPSLVKHFMPRFQYFDEDYGNLKGLTLNGFEQDRRFLNEMSRDDFLRIARDIKDRLTDEVIDRAVMSWPESIYELHGPKIAGTLKIRRDALPEVADQLYSLHAGVVDVVGTNKHEHFVVEHRSDSVTVTVSKTKKDGEVVRVVYRRTFSEKETDDIRLYGLAGNDAFYVGGEHPSSIAIRAIGGAGDDVFASSLSGTRFYDTPKGTHIEPLTAARVMISDEPGINRYDSREFKHDARLPVTFFGFNPDDGLFVGGGFKIIRHGFRKLPYAVQHVVKGNVAARTLGFNVTYDGHYVGAFGDWDMKLSGAYLSPNNIRNFHGLGNETANTVDDRKFYEAQLTDFVMSTSIYKRFEDVLEVYAGPSIHFVHVRRDDDRLVARPQPGISESSFEPQWYLGGQAALRLDAVDNSFNPEIGIRWDGAGAVNVGVSDGAETYTTLSSSLAAYVSPTHDRQVTFAARIGTAHNLGDFPFYGAATLGSKSNFRGFRSTRFAGRTSLYQNVDLRIELFKFSTFLAIGKAGIHAFVDNGRVWTDGEKSDVWHQGYGGGLWFEMFDLFVLQATAGFSKEDPIVTMGFGFLY